MAMFAVMVLAPHAARASQPFEHSIYGFQGGAGDGELPYGGVVAGSDGTYFGTTVYGGALNGGTVYELSATAKDYAEKVVYNFGSRSSSQPDGFNPYSGVLRDASGALYGTTMNYGAPSLVGYGAVYKLTPSPSGYVEQILWDAGEMGSGAGAYPLGGVAMSGVDLYTANSQGGANGDGNVLKFTPFRHGYNVRVIYAFGAAADDGSSPAAGLLAGASEDQAVLGTTEFGGGSSQCGTVFALTPHDGKYIESVLHRFGGTDGCNPEAALVADRGGNVFGTTANGGLSAGHCCGTVFELARTGSATYTYKLLYTFQGGGDGAQPMAALLVGEAQTTLYGTTLAGGAGYGTVYELKLSGTHYNETVLHTFFGYPTDGANPRGSLIETKRGLFGTTVYGGFAANFGTVFSI